ncbi:hypothetical protein [Nocardia barduliensis]|uniref:hypothetical protein n=1 Tax=Nocardia barduliensis TaxID=2736643 RepID=UPI001573A6BD|nr:hypothetical protein [Nocardia barduliensis]
MAAETKTRRWLASIGAGVVLCVGCCLAPLLIAAGILGSGTLLVSLSWLEPLGFALIGLGVVGLGWPRLRARRRGCANTSTDTADGSCASIGCGCSTAPAAAAEAGIQDLRL